MTNDTKINHHNLLLFAGSLIFAIMLAELVLRFILPAPIIWKYPQEHYISDPEIGHWLEPGQQSFTHDKVVRTNSVGIRDSEYTSWPHSNVYRILALGDSQTFGNGLDLADTWPKQLETMLNGSGERVKFEVLNCGLPASDTWQHEIIFNRMLANYHPDAVVLAFYVNDVVQRNFLSPKQKLAASSLRTRIVFILKRSALLLTLRDALNSVLNKNYSSSTHQEDIAPGHTNEKGWQQVEFSISQIKKTSDKNNLLFLLVSLPRRDQVDGRLSENYYNQRLQLIAEKYKIPFINILEPLMLSYEEYGKNLFIPWDGHNSKITNRILAEQISRTIMTSGMDIW